MRFIDRDIDGTIINVFTEQQRDRQESVANDHPDLIAWRQTKIDREAAIAAMEAARDAGIAANLPSWDQVETAIKEAFPDPAQQKVVLKQSRVVYWLAKNSPE